MVRTAWEVEGVVLWLPCKMSNSHGALVVNNSRNLSNFNENLRSVVADNDFVLSTLQK